MLYDVDWTKSMQQSFSFYKVNPNTWKDQEPLDMVISANITRDSSDESLGYATFSADNVFGEFYVRTYLDVTQNGFFHHIPLSTNLLQTTDVGYDGKRKTNSIEAYTPLIELSEKNPDLGFYFPEASNILDESKKWIRQLCRAPLLDWVTSSYTDIFVKDQNGFVAGTEETWLSYLTAFLKNCNHVFRLTELGEIYLDLDDPSKELQAVWTYTDEENASILYPDIATTQDLYSIPNVVELVISRPSEDGVLIRAINDNPNSIVSTVSRGREVVKRYNNPDVVGYDTMEQFQQLADKLLDELSSAEYQIQYRHGFCPVKLGDCVRINYKKAGIENLRCKVIKQEISCVPGCPVDETASYTVNLRTGGIV